MKIFIPFKSKNIGGSSTFVAIFSNELAKRGHKVTFEFQNDYDILFIIADCPLRYILHAKWKRKKIIQRLDGVYNLAANGYFFPILNLKMKIIHNWFSDFAIYQSEFSKFSCEKFLGNKKKYAKIYNGVEISYNLACPAKKSEGVKLITFAKFRRYDQIQPIIEAVKKLPKEYSLDIYGIFGKNLSKSFAVIESENVKFKEHLAHENLLKILNQYDIFLFSDQSACPNSVLEALASGLPVVAYDRGSINELIESGYNGKIIKLKSHDPFTNKYPFTDNDYNNFAEEIKTISNNVFQYKKNAKESAKKFNLENMIMKYIKILNL